MSQHPARDLAGAVEPFAGQVYFSKECHQNYEKLGFSASPGDMNGVALPDGVAYFCSRGSVMGQVPGELIASAFAVFNPAVVVPAVTHGWTVTEATTICAARTDGAVGALTRILGDEPAGLDRATELLQQATAELRPEGRPLYAGLTSLGLPGTPMGDAWRLADQLREFRGDAHTAAWTTHGFDATEIGMLSELYWGLPSRSYIRSRAWSDEELDAAEARLEARGLMADHQLTPEGQEVREQVEVTTDAQCAVIVDALGDGLPELLDLLLPWDAAIREAGGYPASGPHDLAGLAR